LIYYMPDKLPSFFLLSSEVSHALAMDLPVVALESTVITHGLPYPENLRLALDMESEVRAAGATPATIAVIDGKVCVGLNQLKLERLASEAKEKDLHKISTRDFAPVVARHESGGTTVAGTLAVAQRTGIKVFATGGIGGVHRQAPFDVSADLEMLARTPLVVVCAGAKLILDLPATLERLETLGVPVIGYQTDEFPAFYSRSSKLKTSGRANTPEEAAVIARTHWEMGFQSAVLVTIPVPEDLEVPHNIIDGAIQKALEEAQEQEVHGQQVTPFLLQRVTELTKGASLRANLALLLNNAHLAATISRYLYRGTKRAV
jgi:pseudouridine-5'-phosphate glycosidase